MLHDRCSYDNKSHSSPWKTTTTPGLLLYQSPALIEYILHIVQLYIVICFLWNIASVTCFLCSLSLDTFSCILCTIHCPQTGLSVKSMHDNEIPCLGSHMLYTHSSLGTQALYGYSYILPQLWGAI